MIGIVHNWHLKLRGMKCPIHLIQRKNTLLSTQKMFWNTKRGFCFAKSHLLATLLRGMGIPTGFCYQRVLRKGTIESGYALHGLNAVYLPDTGWFRLDPRGNKPGINSQFTIEKEQLAYPIRVELGEVDYPQVLFASLPSVIEAMHASRNCEELFYKRPEEI
ncbi:MAG TPA: transglutaminase-like domain-containing protein [Aequorivita sp.]|nr:transglutaminase-like domain-containing protein [Aequorivita sp.]